MEPNFLLNEIVNLQKNKDWKSILDLNGDSNSNQMARKVLWAWPSEDNLIFLRDVLMRHQVRGVTSVGCGCGLLEWILQEYTGLPVVGVEVNREWWESKYAVTPFIPLTYVCEETGDFECPQTFALMFCYFNDGRAFRKYIERYRGEVVIIIGPAEGAGRHTDPQPFNPQFGDSQWHLSVFQEIRQTKDFIAVYLKHIT